MIADQTFHQGALAGAVLAQERHERARPNAQRHIVERGEGAEALGHAEDLDCDRTALTPRRRADARHQADSRMAAMKSVERDTAPNTPPCIVTILIAAW